MQRQQQQHQQQTTLMATASPNTFINPVAFATTTQMPHIGLGALTLPNALAAQAVANANAGMPQYHYVANAGMLYMLLIHATYAANICYEFFAANTWNKRC